MKVLVCVDGSEHSRKGMEKTLLLAKLPEVEEIGIIHVVQGMAGIWGGHSDVFTETDVARAKELYELEKSKGEQILEDAEKYFSDSGKKVVTILREGHPSHTIVEVAHDEGYDLVVIGSRGLGGLKKFLLGSVSNAVAQEAKDASVLLVK